MITDSVDTDSGCADDTTSHIAWVILELALQTKQVSEVLVALRTR